MSQCFLVVVDMQNDFVTGALGTPEAAAIADAVVRRASSFDGEVVFTLDTHFDNYLNTQEGKNLPVPHCIRKSEGWQLIPELEKLRAERSYLVFEKPAFGSIDLMNYLAQCDAYEPIESIELIGVCTDICVVSNALLIKAALPEIPVIVDSALCAGVTPEAHEAALATMRSCQVEVR